MASAEGFVRSDIRREDAGLFRKHLGKDGAAQPHVESSSFRRCRIAGYHLARLSVLQQDAAAIGVAEDAEQAVDDFGQQGGQVERAGQAIADFQDRLELGLGIDIEARERPAAALHR